MNGKLTVLKLVAVALVAAVLVFPSDAIPLPFGARFILLSALAIGAVIWVTAEDAQAEQERERKFNEARHRRQHEQDEKQRRHKDGE